MRSGLLVIVGKCDEVNERFSGKEQTSYISAMDERMVLIAYQIAFLLKTGNQVHLRNF